MNDKDRNLWTFSPVLILLKFCKEMLMFLKTGHVKNSCGFTFFQNTFKRLSVVDIWLELLSILCAVFW